MKTFRAGLKRAVIVCCLIGCITPPLWAEAPDYWRAEQELNAQLSHHTSGELAAFLPAPVYPRDPYDAFRGFLILHRAGHEKSLIEFFSEFPALSPALSPSTLGDLANRLIGREQWALARRFMEINPQATPGWAYVFLRHWHEQDPAENIDRWIQDRMPGNPTFWTEQRFYFAENTGALGQLIEKYRAHLSANPDDLNPALELARGFSPGSRDAPLKIDWLADLFRPAAASDAYQVGSILTRKAPTAARALLEVALDMPFSPKDVEYLQGLVSSRALVREPTEPQLRYSIKQALLSVLLATKDGPAAQRLMEELASQATDGYSGISLHLAGQTQLMSGARFVENHIRAAESIPENRDSPEYWRGRARYFSGRKEWNEAIDAYGKAVDLTAFPSPEAAAFNSQGDDGQMRYWCVRGMAAVLEAKGERKQAVDYLLAEVPRWPANHKLVDHLVWTIFADYGDHLPKLSSREPEALWSYFSAREDWSRGVERGLGGIATKLHKDQQDEFWTRAEGLAAGNPTRSKVLGWVMNRSGENRRARPLLEYAVANLSPGKARNGAVWTLWEIFADTRQWADAEALMVKEPLDTDWDSGLECLSRVARGALEQGDKVMAIRFWSRVVDRDRTYTKSLDELARGGLRTELVELYQNLANREPACTAATRILQGLAQ